MWVQCIQFINENIGKHNSCCTAPPPHGTTPRPPPSRRPTTTCPLAWLSRPPSLTHPLNHVPGSRRAGCRHLGTRYIYRDAWPRHVQASSASGSAGGTHCMSSCPPYPPQASAQARTPCRAPPWLDGGARCRGASAPRTCSPPLPHTWGRNMKSPAMGVVTTSLKA